MVDRENGYVVTKHVDGGEDEDHFIKMPDYYEKGWYITGISINAFRHRMQKRFIVFKGDGAYVRRMSYWFHVQMRCDFDDRNEIEQKIGIYRKNKAVHHESLWDFYKHIGYDYKKNKLEVEPVFIRGSIK